VRGHIPNFSHLFFFKRGKAESFVESLKKSSPPFGKGRPGGIYVMAFSKNHIDTFLLIPIKERKQRANRVSEEMKWIEGNKEAVE
jgi:hypothetical protein